MCHLDVTEDTHADTVARLWYFPSIHSLKLSLDYPGQSAFEYYDRTAEYTYEGENRRPRGGRLQYDQSILEAAFTLKHLSSLNLAVPCGDCFGQFPWETMTGLRELYTHFSNRVAQGTFAFLPRIPSLEHLQVDLDFFSLPGLRFLTSMTSLDLCLAPPKMA